MRIYSNRDIFIYGHSYIGQSGKAELVRDWIESAWYSLTHQHATYQHHICTCEDLFWWTGELASGIESVTYSPVSYHSSVI